jgi:hypothetical protein
LTLSTAGERDSISDVDADGSASKVTLSAADGTDAGVAHGLTFTTSSGSGDAAMTFTGTAGDINTALDGLVYAPTPSFNGATTITIVTNDQGNSGSGGAKSDTDTVNITVSAVNDAPVLTFPAAVQAIDEDTPLTFNSGNGNLIAITTGTNWGTRLVTRRRQTARCCRTRAACRSRAATAPPMPR